MSITLNIEILYKYISNALEIPGISQKLSNVSFKKLIEKNLNIYRFISGSETEQCKKLFEMYKNTGNEFKFDLDFSYDVSNIEDDINYIKIFVKNIFNVDLENFDPNKISEPSTNINETNPSSQIQIPSFITANNSLSDVQKNAFFLAPAQIRVQNEIKQGKIFAFDSKPKGIPIIKITVGVLLLLASISSIILSIFMLLANNAETPIPGSDGKHLRTNNTWPAMLDFLMATVYAYTSYNMFSPIFSKKNINENKKYYLAWQPIFLVGFFFVISLVMEIFSINGWTIFELIKSMSTIESNESIKYALNGWYILNIFSYVFIFLIGAAVSLAIVYNPKYDTKKLESIVKKYVDEMIGGVKA